MEILVGVNSDPQSQDALALGVALAEALNGSLVAVNVYPVAYDYPSAGHVDAEWNAYLREQSTEALEWTREKLEDRPDVEYISHPHRSSGVGLAEVAEQRGSDMIVIGSAPGGTEDHITGGSTSDQLLHGSPAPVALAPLGYRSWAPSTIKRTIVAYQRNSQTESFLRNAVKVLVANGISVSDHLELITLAHSLPRELRKAMAAGEHDDAQTQFNEFASAALKEGRDIICSVAQDADGVKGTVLSSENVVRALAQFDWEDDDILIVGSTGKGPIKRVFLGDMTYKLIKAATIPVIVVPRNAR